MSLRDANPVDAKSPKRIAIVIANSAVSTTTGWPVGFWWSEITHPYFASTERDGHRTTEFLRSGDGCHDD
jgi:hypothetical protein